MKKSFVCILLLIFLCCLEAKAQIVISSDMFYSTSTVECTLVDSLSRKPIEYASAFLVPKGDSTITNFTLSDSTGTVKFEKVTTGAYLMNVDYLGYRSVQKEIYVKKQSHNLGRIVMSPSRNVIAGGKVVDYASPISQIGDTLVYNATAFGMSDNAMLGDLLKKMPGMEVGGDGEVKVNGESVRKITVNGKTFFFDDKKTALENLPAKIVDKIKVVKQDSKSSQFTGIADKEKETVMDVALKEEYKKGWFGNIAAKGGATVIGKKEERPLSDNPGALYDGSVMAAGYTEENQVTFIGSARNVADSDGGAMMIVYNGDNEDSFFTGGLQDSYQAGINLNSSAIKGMDLSGTVNYRHTTGRNAKESARTTFMEQEEDNLHSSSSEDGISRKNSFSMELELENTEQDKLFMFMSADLRYQLGNSLKHTAADTYDNSENMLSSTLSDVFNKDDGGNAWVYFEIGAKDLGKERRSLKFTADYDYTGGKGLSKNFSKYETSGLNLLYDSRNNMHRLYAKLEYIEPIAEFWDIDLQLSTNSGLSDNSRTAYGSADADIAFSPDFDDRDSFSEINDIYSSLSENRSMHNTARLLVQWKKDKTHLHFGASAMALYEETYSKSSGIESVTGKDEWLWNFSPFIYFKHTTEKNLNLNLNWIARSDSPSSRLKLPVLDITVPSYLSMGNIWLKPSVNNYINGRIFRFDSESQRRLTIYLSGSFTTDNTVYASWFDNEGIRYSVPVNSAKPSSSANIYGFFNTPLDKKKRLTLDLGAEARIGNSFSYQSVTRSEGIDINSFDYYGFMSEFWGDNSKGENFYSGASGFAESRTLSGSAAANASLRFRLENLYTSAGYRFTYGYSRYSLDSRANTNTFDHNLNLKIEYSLPLGFEVKSDFTYRFRKGYLQGYDLSENIWNMSLTKDIKAFTLSLSVYDILNGKRSFSHTAAENYVEDIYSLVMGRHIMFGLKWNFGKMNESNSDNANSANFNMLF